jgi:hypothetical protein
MLNLQDNYARDQVQKMQNNSMQAINPYNAVFAPNKPTLTPPRLLKT